MAERADFDVDGHLHGCRFYSDCAATCGGPLYALAEDQEAALARVEGLCARWDALTKGESATTAAIRAAIRGGE